MKSTSFRPPAPSRFHVRGFLLPAALAWVLAGPAPSGAAERTVLGELYSAYF